MMLADPVAKQQEKELKARAERSGKEVETMVKHYECANEVDELVPA